jgi:hypothetical protein
VKGGAATDPKIQQCIQFLWDYLAVRDEPRPADVAFVFGREDFCIAEKALQLYQSGHVPLLLLLGGHGRLTGNLGTSESEAFKAWLLERSVPHRAMLAESRSSNTGENVDEALKLIRENGIDAKSVILITHGPHARRCLGAVRIRCPDLKLISCPDECSLPDIESPAGIEAVKELVGEVERFAKYAKLGYVREEDVPPDIEACRRKVQRWLEAS